MDPEPRLPPVDPGSRADPLGVQPSDTMRPPTLAGRIDQVLADLEGHRHDPRLLAVVVAAALSITAGAFLLTRPGDAVDVDDLIPRVALETTLTPTTEAVPFVVHVSGAVREPGVYTLPSTGRVLDAIAAAGGALIEADVHQLNLAAPLLDGLQIRVPVEGEVIADPLTMPGPQTNGPIDLNRATSAQLETLPGVGPATAQAIIAWRADHGPFDDVDDLLGVPGIGPSKLAAVADLVTAG